MSLCTKATLAYMRELISSRNSHFDSRLIAQTLQTQLLNKGTQLAEATLALRELEAASSHEDIEAVLNGYPETVWNTMMIDPNGDVWYTASLRDEILHVRSYLPESEGESEIDEVSEINVAGYPIEDVLYNMECMVDSQNVMAASLNPVISGIASDSVTGIHEEISVRLTGLNTRDEIGKSVSSLVSTSTSGADYVANILRGIISAADATIEEKEGSTYPSLNWSGTKVSDVDGNWGIIAAFDSFNMTDIIDGTINTICNVVDGVVTGLWNGLTSLFGGVTEAIDQAIYGRSLNCTDPKKPNFQTPAFIAEWADGTDLFNHPIVHHFTHFKSEKPILKLGAALDSAVKRKLVWDDPDASKGDVKHLFLQSDLLSTSRIVDIAFSASKASALALINSIWAKNNFTVTSITQHTIQGSSTDFFQRFKDDSYPGVGAPVSMLSHIFSHESVHIPLYVREATSDSGGQASQQLTIQSEYQYDGDFNSIEISCPLSYESIVDNAPISSDGYLKVALRHGVACSDAEGSGATTQASKHLCVAYIKPSDVTDWFTQPGLPVILTFIFNGNGDYAAYLVNPMNGKGAPVKVQGTVAYSRHIMAMFNGLSHSPRSLSFKQYVTCPQGTKATLRMGARVIIRYRAKPDVSFSNALNDYVEQPSDDAVWKLADDSSSASNPIRSIRMLTIDRPKTNIDTEYSFYTCKETVKNNLVAANTDLGMHYWDSFLVQSGKYDLSLGSWISVDRYGEVKHSECHTPPPSNYRNLGSPPDVDWPICVGLHQSRCDYLDFLIKQWNLNAAFLPSGTQDIMYMWQDLTAWWASIIPSNKLESVQVLAGDGVFNITYAGDGLVSYEDVNAADVIQIQRLKTHSNRAIYDNYANRTPPEFLKYLMLEDALGMLFSWMCDIGILDSSDFTTNFMRYTTTGVNADRNNCCVDWSQYRAAVTFPITTVITNDVGYTLKTDAENATDTWETVGTGVAIAVAIYFGVKLIKKKIHMNEAFKRAKEKSVLEMNGDDLSTLLRRNRKNSKLRSSMAKWGIGLLPGAKDSKDEDIFNELKKRIKECEKDVEDVHLKLDGVSRIIGKFEDS